MAKKTSYPISEGKYYSIYIPDGSNYHIFKFTAQNNGKYDDVIGEPRMRDWMNPYPHDFTIENGILITDLGYIKFKYEISGDILIPTEFSFAGNIPDQKRFDATCDYKDAHIHFYRNGQLEYSLIGPSDKRFLFRGFYVRKDNFIITCMDAGSEKQNFCFAVYKNRLNSSVLVKESLFYEIQNEVNYINERISIFNESDINWFDPEDL